MVIATLNTREAIPSAQKALEIPIAATRASANKARATPTATRAQKRHRATLMHGLRMLDRRVDAQRGQPQQDPLVIPGFDIQVITIAISVMTANHGTAVPKQVGIQRRDLNGPSLSAALMIAVQQSAALARVRDPTAKAQQVARIQTEPRRQEARQLKVGKADPLKQNQLTATRRAKPAVRPARGANIATTAAAVQRDVAVRDLRS